MVDNTVLIPGGGSNALHPLALMALQQRGQLGEGNLAYKEQLLALKQQQVDNQLAKAALSQENTAAAKKDITNAIANSVVGLPGEAAGPYLPDVNRAVNSLALSGKVGPAKTVSDFLEQQAKQRVQEGLADENAAKAKSETEKIIDTHLTRWKNMSNMVDSPEKAAAFSRAMLDDPSMADYAHIAGDPEQTAAKNAELYAKDPVAWHTGIANLTGEQLIAAIKPKIETVGAGQSLVAVSPSGTSATSLMTTPAAAPAPSNLLKIMQERDALPDGDPRKAVLDAYIKKETTSPSTTSLTKDALDIEAQKVLNGQQISVGYRSSGSTSAIMNRVAEIQAAAGVSPEDTAKFIAEAKQNITANTGIVKSATSGKLADKINSFNTATSHLGLMNELGAALKNGEGSQTANAIYNAIAEEFGGVAPTEFRTAKNIVANEIIKSIVPSGGTEADRAKAEKSFNAANTPEQLAGAIDTVRKLMGGNLASIKLNYEQTGRKDFANKLTPEAQKALDLAQTKPKLEKGVDTSNPLLKDGL